MTTDMRSALEAACAQLDKAADQFAFYADEHAKKGTKGGETKGAVNHQWALACARISNEARQSLDTSGWQDISTAPLDTEIWLTDGIWQWQGHGFQWTKMPKALFTLGICYPTHWMPLPAAPTPKGSEA